ncbi:Cyclic nucleotide-binding domain protein [compost metagenome]
MFRSLTSEEKDALSQSMTPLEIPADQVILKIGEVSDDLLVIGTGVVSASIVNGDGLMEAGRMGPGEILGEEGILDGDTTQAEFRSLSACTLYRIDKNAVRSCLEQRTEVKLALSKLQRFRQQASQSLLMQKPAVIKKGGFLNWLHNKV